MGVGVEVGWRILSTRGDVTRCRSSSSYRRIARKGYGHLLKICWMESDTDRHGLVRKRGHLEAIQFNAAATLHPVREGLRHSYLARETTRCFAEGCILEHIVFLVRDGSNTPAWCTINVAASGGIAAVSCVTQVRMACSTFQFAATCSFNARQIVSFGHFHKGLANVAVDIVPSAIMRVKAQRHCRSCVDGCWRRRSGRARARATCGCDVSGVHDGWAPHVSVVSLLRLRHAETATPPRPNDEALTEIIEIMP